MRRITSHRPSPAMVVACIALIVALGGTSYAIQALPKSSVGSKQLKNNAVTSKKIKNGAVNANKVKNGSLLSADFKAGQLPAGPQGPRGPQGERGVQGVQGVQGPAGPITRLLPSEVTLRGVYGIAARSTANSVQAPISFILALPSDPATHYVPAAGPAPGQCPGSVNDPQAFPGNLCVYERVASGTTGVLIDFPADTGSARFGAIVQGNTAGSVDAVVKGTWAVTAP
jgi:hypothetical protein